MEIKHTGKIEDVIVDIMKLDRDVTYDISIKKHREKRSLNANAYLWSLITQIADVMRLSKEEVYMQMLKEYGQSIVISVRSDIDISQNKGLYYEYFGTGEVDGKEFTHYKIFTHSSDMDTKSFSILLDGVIQEASNLDIPTISDDELNIMKGQYNDTRTKG